MSRCHRVRLPVFLRGRVTPLPSSIGPRGSSEAHRDARAMLDESWLLVIFVEIIFGLIFGYVYGQRAGMVEKYLRRRA